MLVHLKRCLIKIALCSGLSMMISNAYAQDASLTYLKQIANYTYGTLKAVNNLPTYLSNIALSSMSVMMPDNTESTGALTSQLQNFSSKLLEVDSQRIALQDGLARTVLFKDAVSLPQLYNYLNDINYGTLLGQPLLPPNPNRRGIDEALNFVTNAAGSNIPHQLPSPSWRGSGIRAYESYFRTVKSIESYNQFILSDLYVNYKNGNSLNNLQQDLIRRASSPTWFQEVSSNYIGIVLRQILLFQSQAFILLSESLKVQKQLLYTQAMSNSLLILNGSLSEENLLRRAATANR